MRFFCSSKSPMAAATISVLSFLGMKDHSITWHLYMHQPLPSEIRIMLRARCGKRDRGVAAGSSVRASRKTRLQDRVALKVVRLDPPRDICMSPYADTLGAE